MDKRDRVMQHLRVSQRVDTADNRNIEPETLPWSEMEGVELGSCAQWGARPDERF